MNVEYHYDDECGEHYSDVKRTGTSLKTCEKCGWEFGWHGNALEHCVCCNWDGPCVCPAGLEKKGEVNG